MPQINAIYDTHFHIIDRGFPLVENQGYLPPLFSVDQYWQRVHGLNVVGGNVVAGSFQGFDQTFMFDALARFGPTFTGVIQIPPETSDQDIRRLNNAGVRAVRFNLFRGGSAGLDDMESLSKRVYDLVGWHAEIYMDAAMLAQIAPIVRRLPKVSIDHLGMTQKGLPHLTKLAEKGVKVKASGFGRITVDVVSALKDLSRANPNCLMFGSDLPSQRASRPFDPSDVDLIAEHMGEDLIDRVFWKNAVEFYRPASIHSKADGADQMG